MWTDVSPGELLRPKHQVFLLFSSLVDQLGVTDLGIICIRFREEGRLVA
jgi:hypothetical protein